MSLPSSAWFVKDGQIVGRAPCNCGWFLNGSALLRAAWDAWHQAKSLVDKGVHEKNLEDMSDGEREWYEGYTKWFTTREDLLAFDSCHLYDCILPRDVFVAMHHNPDVEPKLAAVADKGLYKDEGQLKAAITATKLARNFE